MPYGAVTLRPGIDTEFTPTLNQAGYSTCNLIRFREGLAEKLGGWARYYDFAIGSTIRALHAWQDLNLNTYLAVGALSTLSVITNGVNTVITPQQTVTNPAVNFSTTNGSATVNIVDAGITPSTSNTVFIETQVSIGGIVLFGVYPIATVTGAHAYTITAASLATATVANAGAVASYTTTNASSAVAVTLNNHGFSIGDTYYSLVATTGGGVMISGAYVVQAVTSANVFTITVNSPATSGATFSQNSANARILYYITIGPQVGAAGYSLGGYGTGGYSIGVAAPVGSGTPITATDWTLDNWGEILVACPDGGAIYSWRPNTGFQTATIIANSPNVNTGIFIAMPEQILVAYGSSTTDGVRDPLLVRWSDVSDFNVWDTSSVNQAGSQRLTSGSKIVGGIQAPQQGLIWTDVSLWSMQYVQPPFVFGFTEIMTGCGLVGKHAVGVLGNTVFWMSQKQFFTLGGGGPQPLPCPVWDVIFQNIDTTNLDKVCCATNSEFNEVTWYFPSANGGGVVDQYVKYNIAEKAWDYGTLGRTAWIDQSVLGAPIGADPSTVIFQHEISTNDDGAPMNSFFESGYFALAEGETFVTIDFILPDMKWGTLSGAQAASVQISVTTTDYPNGTPRLAGPYTMTAALDYINTRCRGRMAKVKIASSDLDSFWRIGRLRYRFANDGRR